MNVLKQLKTSILLITCVLCQHVYARQGQPMVSGIVQDVLGQPLIGVSVKAINQSSGKSFQASTSEKGLFQFMQMSFGGPYDFVFSYIGYQSDTLRNYQLSAGKQV